MAAARSFFRTIKKVLVPGESDPIEAWYTPGEVLGRGSFATVIRAVEKASGEAVAIKCIKKGGKTTIKLLEQEVEVLNHVQHPNCVGIREIIDSPSTLYLVMDLCTGGELFAWISTRERFSEREASLVIKDVLLGLCYLHERGIVHRDLKPENLLLEVRGPEPRIKITDFGLSKLVQGKRQFLFSRCGTPAYVAPEVLLGEPYTSKVDLWAVGVITYLVIAGYAPFFAKTLDDLFDVIIRCDFAFHAKYWSHVSDCCMHFIECLIEADPSKRYSAQQALEHPWITGFIPKAPTLRSMAGIRVYNLTRSNYSVPSDSDSTSGLSVEQPPAAPSEPRPPPDAPEDPVRTLDPWRYFEESIGEARVCAGLSLTSSAFQNLLEEEQARTPSSSTSSSAALLPPPSTASASATSSASSSSSSSPLSSAGFSQSTFVSPPRESTQDRLFFFDTQVVVDTSRVPDKYPLWPSFEEAAQRGRLTGCYDITLVLEELSRPSVQKDRAAELGFVRPFLLLVSMSPYSRVLFAQSLKIPIVDRIWFGNPRMEAFELLTAEKRGIIARTARFRDAGFGEWLGSVNWFDSLWRVCQKTFTHKKDPADLKEKIVDYKNYTEKVGRAKVCNGCVDPNDSGLIEELEAQFLLELTNKMYRFRQQAGVGIAHAPKVFESIAQIEQAHPAVQRMLENFEVAGFDRRRDEEMVLMFTNAYFSQRLMRTDADKGSSSLFWHNELRKTPHTVIKRSITYAKLLPLVYGLCLQRCILGAVGIPLTQFYPEHRKHL